MQDRDFKGIWIPKAVWLDSRLTMLEKGILMEIDSLDNGEDGCYASNDYIAEFCQCGVTKVSNAISKLIELGYLSLKSFDGRQRILQSRLTKSVRQSYKNCETDLQNLQQSNNSIKLNNTNKETVNIYIHEIIDYLNTVCGTSYKASTEKTKSLINARLKEGFTVDDFKTVIDKKSREWLNTDYAKYLRPETLFGTKFESYLNALSTRGQAGHKADTMDMLKELYHKYEEEENETD